MKDVVDRLLAVGKAPIAAKSPLNDSARSLGGTAQHSPEAESPFQLSPSVSEEESSAEEDAGGLTRR
jgi:hypothetical protein